MKTIALCFSTPGLERGEYKHHSYGKKYPGAGWMKHLHAIGPSKGFQVIDGKNCIAMEFNPKEVCIVQEENNPDGILLQKLGAEKSVITCLESPLFTPLFYDDRKDEGFKHRVYFGPCQSDFPSFQFSGATDPLHFPSFDNEDIRDPVPWSDRKLLCMVASNKHYSGLGDRWKDSPSFGLAMKTQLHDYRYNAIKHFASNPEFHLYGRGWPDGRECDDKIDTIRNYKFALCFENGAYPGYITEKIIDCFVAGVIPIYVGDPDIHLKIPFLSFIDGRGFEEFSDLEKFLNEFDNHERFIAAGRSFLDSMAGQMYSNSHFAKRILEMCEQ